MTNLHAAIISGCDDNLRRRRLGRRSGFSGGGSCGALHSGGDFSRVPQRDRANGRSAAAQKRAKRAGFFGGGDDAGQERDQLLAKRLVKAVAKSAAQVFVIT